MNYKERRPGVGEYDLTRFKCLSKANETVFEMPKFKSINQIGVKQLSSKRRVLSAAPARSAEKLNENRGNLSPSPSIVVSDVALSVNLGKRLGGPGSPNNNFMMKASREQRKKTFIPECESAYRNTLGPGPSKYSQVGIKEYIHGHAFRATIGNVSVHFKLT